MENAYKVEVFDYKQTQFLGIKEVVKFDKLPEFFERNYAKLMTHLKQNEIECIGIPAAIYYGWNMENNETTVAAALPVDKPISVDEVMVIDMPARKAYMTDYFGPYDKMMPAYTALMSKMEKDQAEMDFPCLELYMNDPAVIKDPSKWHTRIIVFYK